MEIDINKDETLHTVMYDKIVDNRVLSITSILKHTTIFVFLWSVEM